MVAKLICPNCQADLEDDLVASTGKAECPFCGGDVSRVVPPAPRDGDQGQRFADELQAAPVESFGVARPPAVDEASPIRVPAAPVSTRPAPEGNRIEIVERSPARLVFYVPPGGGHRWTMAIVLGIVMAVIPLVVIPNLFVAGQLVLAPLVFLGIFALGGLIFATLWARLYFTRLYLSLEPERVIAQRILFNRKRLKTTQLGPESCATLVVAYEQNRRPVYAVAIHGVSRTEKFGHLLTQPEKDWLVDEINAFLRPGAAAPRAVARASGFYDETPPPLDPAANPQGSGITVLEASPQRLLLRTPLVTRGAHVRALTATVAAVVAVFVAMAVLFFAGLMAMFLNVVVFAPILFPLVVIFGLIRGTAEVELTPEWLTACWKIGPLRFRRRFPTSNITAVVVRRSRNPRLRAPAGGKARRRDHSIATCLVSAGPKTMTLSLIHRDATAQALGGMIRWQLALLQHAVGDE
jgi:hypothetical protein